MSPDPTQVTALAGRIIELAGWEVLFSTILFAIVAGLARLLRDAAPSLRHALWGLVLLRLVLPVDLAQPLSLGGLATRLGLTERSEAAWLDAWPGHGDVEGGGIGSVPVLSVPEAASPGAPVWTLALAWLAGSLMVGGRAVRRRLRYRGLIRRSRIVRDPGVLVRTKDLRRRLGVRRPVRVVSSPARHVPFTYGVLRPAIFLPAVVVDASHPEMLEAVLAHELAHVRRWDDLLVRLQMLITALYFFHPVAWLASSRMREESEHVCDELVLARCGIRPRAYGRSLLAVLRLGLAAEPPPAPAFARRNRRLRMRIEMITGSAVRRSRRWTPHPAPVAAVLGLLLLPMAGVAGSRADSGEVDAPARGAQRVTLTNPMPGARVTSAYGPATDPFTGAARQHEGIDVAGRGGAPIFAPAPGRVELATAEYEGGAAYGTVVLLDHGDGVKTFYSHLGRLMVRAGQRVERGDVVAFQGATGRVTGPHLHFEVRVDGQRRDPAEFISDWR